MCSAPSRAGGGWEPAAALMRRRCLRSSDVGVCPLCRKVVEYGVCCAACGGWFHATESCCGEALADAFLRSGREAWCCLNCAPRNEPPPAAAAASEKTPAPAALTADLASWRHAFRLLADACGGCGRQIQLARRHVRCAQCDLAFHASEECTGLSAAKVEGACSDASWRCPTCLLHETGCTVPGGVIDEDVAKGKETRPIPIINEARPGTLPSAPHRATSAPARVRSLQPRHRKLTT